LQKNDWPRYVEQEPEIYEQEEWQKLFDACNPEERLWFEFFLKTGMREQEAMHCSWQDVNLSRGTVTVRYKPEYGFSPKAYKEREIPIPADLIERLKEWKAKADKMCGLVFPTAGCKPKLDFLDCLKAVAKRAKLNCGHCGGCKGKLKLCEHWFLHKFRATFCTMQLRAGVDLRTVQMWMGHSDIESTMRYLKPARDQKTREMVKAAFV
jgi:integrase/recombinase XerD